MSRRLRRLGFIAHLWRIWKKRHGIYISLAERARMIKAVDAVESDPLRLAKIRACERRWGA